MIEELPTKERWSAEEIDLLLKYFKTAWAKLTLFQKLQSLNPNRSYEAMTRQIRRMKAKGMEKPKQSAIKKLRVGYLDIETSNLVADFGMILTWYIKAAGKNHYDFAIITKKEIHDYSFDKRVVSELLDALDNYDVLYVHWGVDRRFDIPFIRTRAFVHNLENKLPKRMEKFILDTWPIARNKLKLHSNRLDSIAEVLGIPVKKTPLSPKRWNLARAGHPDSLEYIALHNKRDVQILERIHKKLAIVENPI